MNGSVETATKAPSNEKWILNNDSKGDAEQDIERAEETTDKCVIRVITRGEMEATKTTINKLFVLSPIDAKDDIEEVLFIIIWILFFILPNAKHKGLPFITCSHHYRWHSL